MVNNHYLCSVFTVPKHVLTSGDTLRDAAATNIKTIKWYVTDVIAVTYVPVQCKYNNWKDQ